MQYITWACSHNEDSKGIIFPRSILSFFGHLSAKFKFSNFQKCEDSMKGLFTLMAKLICGIEKNKDTVKALINAWAFIRIITYHRERGERFIRGYSAHKV